MHQSAVREMVERVIELSRSYAIWWELVEKSNFDQFARVRGNHKDFFDATIHSLFQGFAIISYQLFDKRTDSTSLRVLINSKSTDSVLARQLNDAIDLKLPLLKKVFAIRNKVYGHRDKSRLPEALFEEAGMSPSLMREILDLARDVVCALAESAGLDTKADLEKEILWREKYAREDTRLIMQTLGEQAI